MTRRALTVAAVAALALAASTSASTVGGHPPLVPNDPGWSGQWGLGLMHVAQVWQWVRPGTRPVVATVDTGADASFPDLRGRLVPGWNLVGGDGDTSDVAGHGTDVATVIAAAANNRFGIVGACPICRVMPVKVSIDRTASASIIASGIRWAVDHGARVIVVSIVHGAPVDPAEQPAVDYAASHGAVILASAGNDGGTNPEYPAALPGVVSVAASDPDDRLYPWATHGDWVDLTAPGCEYGSEMCGASYAPPLVAGAIALLTAVVPGLTPVKALDALRATAVPVEGVAGGRIDVLAAARSLGAVPDSGVGASPRIELERGTFARLLRRRLTVSRGPLTLVLTRADARHCTMALRSRTAAYLTRRATRTQLHLSANVARGTYTLDVTCRDTRPRAYALEVKRAPQAR